MQEDGEPGGPSSTQSLLGDKGRRAPPLLPRHPCWAGAAEVRGSRGGEKVQAHTIRDSATAGARPGSRATLLPRRAALVLVIK